MLMGRSQRNDAVTKFINEALLENMKISEIKFKNWGFVNIDAVGRMRSGPLFDIRQIFKSKTTSLTKAYSEQMLASMKTSD